MIWLISGILFGIIALSSWLFVAKSFYAYKIKQILSNHKLILIHETTVSEEFEPSISSTPVIVRIFEKHILLDFGTPTGKIFKKIKVQNEQGELSEMLVLLRLFLSYPYQIYFQKKLDSL